MFLTWDLSTWQAGPNLIILLRSVSTWSITKNNVSRVSTVDPYGTIMSINFGKKLMLFGAISVSALMILISLITLTSSYSYFLKFLIILMATS